MGGNTLSLVDSGVSQCFSSLPLDPWSPNLRYLLLLLTLRLFSDSFSGKR